MISLNLFSLSSFCISDRSCNQALSGRNSKQQSAQHLNDGERWVVEDGQTSLFSVE